MPTRDVTELYRDWPAINEQLHDGVDQASLVRLLYAELQRRSPGLEGSVEEFFRQMTGYRGTLKSNRLYLSFQDVLRTLAREGKLEQVGTRSNVHIYRVSAEEVRGPEEYPSIVHQRRSVPRARELYWPTLFALRAFGGRPALKSEVVARVAHDLRLPSSVVRVLHREDGSSIETELGYRVAWALSRLKKIDTANNPIRAHWIVTEVGRTIEDERQLHQLIDTLRRQPDRRPGQQGPPQLSGPPDHQGRTPDLDSMSSAPGVTSTTRKTLLEWVLQSMRMLADAGIAEPSLESIEHAAKALGWDGNSKSFRSAVRVAKRDELLLAAGHGRYRLPDATVPGSLPTQQPGGPMVKEPAEHPPVQEPPSNPVTAPTPAGSPEVDLANCVTRLADVVAELKDAVDGLAAR